MNIKEELQKIPNTGRIGRFAKVVKSKTSEETAIRIMENSEEYNKLKPVEKADWWNNAIQTMENELGKELSVEIMEICGSKCCGKGQRKTAKKLMDESSSIDEFLEKLSNYEVKEDELEYRQINKNIIIGKHNRCFCGQVKKSDKLFKSNTYCQCSVEFNKQFFEAAFEKPVKVELLRSILNGDEFCEFKIEIIV